jgi:hypothetical protein
MKGKKTKAKRVYILGEARGMNRVQTVAKMLLDDRHHYKMYYDTVFYSNHVLRYLKSLLINPFVILRSNIVFVNTLNVDINIFYEMIWARIFRKKLIVDFYVSVYDTVVLDRKWFKEGSFFAWLARLCDKLFLCLGTHIIFVSKTYGEYSVRLAKIKKKLNTQVMPLGIDERLTVHSGFMYGERETLNICWWGSYQPLHGLETVIKAAALVKQDGWPVKWFFFGNDEQKGKEYAKMIEELEVSDICEISNDYTFANGKLTEFLLQYCDVALGQLGNTGKAEVMTNKFIEACSMNCTVIVGDYADVIESFGNDSVYACARTPEAIAATVARIYGEEKAVLLGRAEKTHAIYEEKFSTQIYVDNMKALLSRI